MTDLLNSGEGLNVDQPAFRSPLNAFLTGSEFMSKFDEGNNNKDGNKWPQDGAGTNGTKYDNTHSDKSFHSTFDMGDMSEAHDDDDDDDESKFSRDFCS